MKIPVVLATAHVEVGTDGGLLVDVDGEPFAGDRLLDRSDLSAVLDEITTTLGTAVRVEVRESDGTVYADIATPPDAEPVVAVPEPAQGSPMSGLSGTGFQPGEEVEIAYVVARQTADASGRADLQLPPALASAHRHRLVLVGVTSRVAAAMEQPS
ncbi:hypothetical protein [Nocardioides sp. W7]|uniref:hypothetical protein n=1 Tax=Nocardioides sp. W7 TaxID=2931390 RepID=UPI001FD1A539|nr:hypothetical protein [Nocardioides sp. W7]